MPLDFRKARTLRIVGKTTVGSAAPVSLRALVLSFITSNPIALADVVVALDADRLAIGAGYKAGTLVWVTGSSKLYIQTADDASQAGSWSDMTGKVAGLKAYQQIASMVTGTLGERSSVKVGGATACYAGTLPRFSDTAAVSSQLTAVANSYAVGDEIFLDGADSDTVYLQGNAATATVLLNVLFE